jgi:hypothetical protein
MKNLLKYFAAGLIVLCAGNAVVAQNPTVINDSLVVNQRVYAKEKLVVDQEAKFKQDIKVLGTARLQGDMIVDGTAKFNSNVKMDGLGTHTTMSTDDKIIIILPNGQLKTVSIGTAMTAGYQPIACIGGDVLNPTWASGLNKIYHVCDPILTGLGTATPQFKLHVEGMTYANKGFLAGHSGANTNALINAYAQSPAGNLLQLGVKIGSGSQELVLTVTNEGEVEWKNLGTDPSLTIRNGDGHALVVYANDGSKILQLEDSGLLRGRRIKVDTDSWADYVFKQGYQLMSLQETEEFIHKNGHLPGVPDEKTLVDKGLDLAEMQRIQMEKIEELYLHMIEMDKKIASLQEENAVLKAELASKND